MMVTKRWERVDFIHIEFAETVGWPSGSKRETLIKDGAFLNRNVVG